MKTKRHEYTWDRSAGRYKGPNGRFVAEPKVRLWLDAALDVASGRIDGLANALRSGTLDPISWEVAMRREVKSVALYSAAAAKGGWAQMSDADYGRVGQYVREQYGYLNQFYRDVRTGKQALDGRLNARAQLYGQAGRPLYHRMEIAEKKLRGMTQRKNVRYKGDSCRGCEEATARGWVDIDDKTIPEIGQRECRTRCRCRWEFS